MGGYLRLELGRTFRAPAFLFYSVFLPVVFVSFYVFDSSSAPEFLRTLAEALPLYPLIHGLSGAMVTGASVSKNLSDLGVIAVWAVLGIWLAVSGFSWEQRRT